MRVAYRFSRRFCRVMLERRLEDVPEWAVLASLADVHAIMLWH